MASNPTELQCFPTQCTLCFCLTCRPTYVVDTPKNLDLQFARYNYQVIAPCLAVTWELPKGQTALLSWPAFPQSLSG